MALNSTRLKTAIITEMQAQGFDTENEHAKTKSLAEAIANAVKEEITTNGQIIIVTGSSSGTYNIT